MSNYLNNKHFEQIAPDNSVLKRLSSKAVHFETEKMEGIIYVNTIVAMRQKSERLIKLNSWGRRTQTTKKWMNYLLNQYNFEMYQKNYERYIDNPYTNNLDTYKDNIILEY